MSGSGGKRAGGSSGGSSGGGGRSVPSVDEVARSDRSAVRRALFSDIQASGPLEGAPKDIPEGRRALFSSPSRESPEREPGGGAPVAVVHCRTCLASTPMSLPAVALALIPSLWLPTRPWPRLMRCPACHRVSWCRIDWPGPF